MITLENQETQEQQMLIVDGQLIGTILYIISLVISLILILNQRQRSQNKEGFLTSKESQILAFANKIFVLLLLFLFLYLDYEAKDLAEKTNQDTNALELQIIASFISFIPVLIGIYVVATDFSNTNLQTAEIENPFA